MSRQEENKIIVNFIAEKSKIITKGSYEEAVAFHLGAIATMLTDISKSLAILADKEESEGEKDERKTESEKI